MSQGAAARRFDVPVSGGCQCGAVRFRATALLDNAHLCHCRMCQKAVGGVFAALVSAPSDALTFTRGTPSVFRSSAKVERGFCAACGTPLFYHDVTGSDYALMIGALDNPSQFPPRSSHGAEGRVAWFGDVLAIADGGVTEGAGWEDWAAAIRRSNRQHPDHDTDTWPPG